MLSWRWVLILRSLGAWRRVGICRHIETNSTLRMENNRFSWHADTYQTTQCSNSNVLMITSYIRQFGNWILDRSFGMEFVIYLHPATFYEEDYKCRLPVVLCRLVDSESTEEAQASWQGNQATVTYRPGVTANAAKASCACHGLWRVLVTKSTGIKISIKRQMCLGLHFQQW
jgi:hypothetical protein